MSEPRSSSIAIPFAVATLAIAAFSAMDAVMKHLVLQLGAYNALVWRMGLVALLGGIAFIALRSPWPTRSVMRIHIIRGLVSTVMGFLFFWGLGRVPLAQGVALAFIAPLIALYLAAVLLHERIERRAILASLLGLAGVVVIFAGQARADLGPEALLGSFAILASACLYAYNIILMRQQALVAGPLEVAFFMSLFTTMGLLPAAPFLAVPPPVEALPAIVAAATLSFVSLMLFAWAYARAQAQHLAPVEYTAFIWAVLFGWVFFAEPVAPATLAGAGMIVAACLLAATRRKPDFAAEVESGVPGGA
jgi:S-adenosylmethionine uptake transporter